MGKAVGKVVKTVVGVVATVVGVVTGNFALVAQGISMTFSALSERSPSKQTTNAATQQRLSKSLVPEAPRKIVLGKTALPTDLRYWEVYGSKYHSYVEVMAAATHRLTSFGNLWIDEAAVPFSGSNATGKYAGSLKRYTRLEGVSGQGMPLGSGSYWNTAASMTGCAYWVLDWAWTQEKLPNGIPSRYTQEGEGSPVYDPRRDVAYGGTHVITDQSTWEYSPLDSNGVPIGRNNALQMLRYLIGWTITSPQTGLKIRVDGRGVDPADINLDSFIEAANNCELQRWYSDCVLSTSDSHSTNEGILEAAAGGKLVDTGGRWSYWVAIDDTANIAAVLDENDLAGDAFEWVPRRPMAEQYNEVAGTYIDPVALYQPRPYAMVKDPAYYAEDGFKKRKTVAFSAVQNSEQAQKLARIILNAGRRQGVFRATFQWRCLVAENYNCVRLTFAPLGFQNKLFRIIEMGLVAEGVDLTLQEEDGAVYLGGTIAPYAPPSAGVGYDPQTQVELEGLALLPVTLEDDGGQGRRDGLQVSWLSPSAHARETEVQYRVAGATIWTAAGPALGRDQLQVVIGPLLAGTTYEVRARHNSHHGVPGLWSLETAVTGTSTRNAPGEVTYDDGVPVEDLRPAQPGADVTGQNTALNTQNVGSRSAQEVLDSLSGLEDEFEGVPAAVAAAQAARDAAQTHEANAELARDITQGLRDGVADLTELATRTARDLLPATFEDGGRAFTGYYYAQPFDNAFDLTIPDPFGYGITKSIETDAFEGLVLQVNGAATNSPRFGTHSVIKAQAGRKLEVAARLKVVLDPTLRYDGGGTTPYNGYTRSYLAIACFDATGAFIENYWQGSIQQEGASGWATFEQFFSFDDILSVFPTTTHVRPLLSLAYDATGTYATNARTRVAFMRVKDVTERAAALEHAQTAQSWSDEAGDHASAADTQRALAETARSQAQDARADAVEAFEDADSARAASVSARDQSVNANREARSAAATTWPSTMAQGERFFIAGLAGDPKSDSIGPAGNWTFPTDPTHGRVMRVTGGASYQHIRTREVIPNVPGRRWLIEALVRNVGGNPDVNAHVNWYGIDATYAANPLEYAGGASVVASGQSSLGASWTKVFYEATIPEGVVSPWLTPNLYFFRGGLDLGIAEVAYIRVRDVTEVAQAAGSASAANQSASTAAAASDLAGDQADAASTDRQLAQAARSGAETARDAAVTARGGAEGAESRAVAAATLSAQVSGNSINQNPTFDAWPTGQALPTGWSLSESGSTGVSRATGHPPHPYAVRVTNALASDSSALQQVFNFGREGYYVLEAEFTLESGSLEGAGLTCRGDVVGGGYVHEQHMWLTLDKDASGAVLGAGLTGRTYRMSKLVRLVGPTIAQTRLYVFSNGMSTYSGQGGAAPKSILWHRAAMRPATQLEIELGEARSSFTDLGSRLQNMAQATADETTARTTAVNTLEARVTRRSRNLVRNPSGREGMTGWATGSPGFYVTEDLTWGHWIRYVFTGDSGQYRYMRSDAMWGGAGQTFTLSGRGYLTGLVSGWVQLAVYGYTDYDGTQGEVLLSQHIYGTEGQPWQTPLPVQTFATPSNIRSMRVWVQMQASGNGTYSDVGFWGLKLEQGSEPTAFTEEAALVGLSGRITEAYDVAADITGRVEATAGLTVQSGSRIAGMRFHAVDGTDSNYSSIDFLADVFRVWDSVNQVGLPPFEIRNGGLRARSAMIDRLAVGASLTVGTANLRVAVQPFDLQVTDGQVVSYGYDLGQAPALTFLGNNLVAPVAGETALLYAENPTPTGFTARLKYQSPGTPTSYSSGFGGHSSDGTAQMYFALAATPQTANVRIQGSVRSYFNNPDWSGGGGPIEQTPDDLSYSDGYMEVTVWGFKNGAWSAIGSMPVYPAWRQGGNSGFSSPPGFYDDAFDVTQSFEVPAGTTHIGVSVGYETYSESYLSGLRLEYQVATSSSVRSATPNGQTSTVTVRPRT